MANLFDPTTINSMTLQNRLVRSATWEGMCEQNGRPTEKVISWYRDLSQGGTGLIISGYTFIRPEGKQLPGKMGICTDDFASDFENLTSAVHDAGGVGHLAIQIAKAAGCHVCTTVGSEKKADFVRNLGADKVNLYN